MSFKIKSIRIQNFRGIRRLRLDLDGKTVIVAGENGSGKSSIIDALEYFFTGHVDKLTGRVDVDERKGIPHLSGGRTEVEVAFQGSGQSLTIPFPRRRVSIPESVQPFFGLAGDHPFVLRRSKILEFVDARPAERYRRISQIVGLGELDAIDDRWRRPLRKVESEVRQLKDRQSDTLNRLRIILEAPTLSTGRISGQISHLLVRAGLEPVNEPHELTMRIEQLRERSRQNSPLLKAERLGAVAKQTRTLLDGLMELLAKQEEFARARRRFWQQSEPLTDGSLEVLLSEAHRILRATEGLQDCPLCEVPISDRLALLGRLRQRLGKLRDVTETRNRLQDLALEIRQRFYAASNQLEILCEALDAEGVSVNKAALQQGVKVLKEGIESISADELSQTRGDLAGEGQTLRALREELRCAEHELIFHGERLELTEAHRRTEALHESLPRVAELWEQFSEVSRKLDRALFVQRQIRLMYDELIAARRRGVERIRRELEEDFERFYQFLHPDEGYEAISIPVQEGKRSSVDLSAKFHREDSTHPLNFWSEGHLDSLGLCIFLAFFKRFGGGLKLMALDDVLTTVDAGHRLRVARLLAREFADYQFIITTHDQLWANQLHRVLASTRLVSLRRWSLEHGADVLANMVSDWAYYERLALRGYVQDAIAGTGRNLEKFLYRMRANLQLAVPAKGAGDYTIGDLYAPFFHWVRTHSISRPDRPRFDQELAALETELDEVWQLRNWAGAHFNEWAATVSVDEAIDFNQAIRALVQSFECPSCRSLMTYNRRARALICPICEPKPPERVSQEYDPEWYERAERLLRSDKEEVRRNVLPMAQSYFRAFLRDIRRKVHLVVPATSDDNYEIGDLYDPFFAWASSHPRNDVAGWPQTIQGYKTHLDGFWRGERWADVPDSQVRRFVTTVYGLIDRFVCPHCGQLLGYHRSSSAYFCSTCDSPGGQERRASAYWFVESH